jgi:hypothetical protein
MATSERVKSLAVHFEKIAYGGAGLLAAMVFLIPFLSTRDLVEGYVAADKARDNFIEKTKDPQPPPPPPPLKPLLEKQWSVAEVSGPWVTPWTTEVKPQAINLKIVEKAPPLVHEAGKVSKITPIRDPKKYKVLLKVEGARGQLKEGTWQSAKLQRKVVEPAPGTGSDFTDLKDFGADQEIKYDDVDVKPGSTYTYRLITEVTPKEGVEVKDPQDVTRTSNELPLLKVIPWEYRIRVISATGFNADSGAAASLNGEVYYWDYGTSKVVPVAKPVWKEKDVFGPKVNGAERYQIWQIEEGKVTIIDRVTNKKEVLTAKENKREVDLPPAMTIETAAAAATAASEEATSKAAKKDTKAAAKAKAAEDEEADDTAKKPTKKPATKDSTKKKPAPKVK